MINNPADSVYLDFVENRSFADVEELETKDRRVALNVYIAMPVVVAITFVIYYFSLLYILI
jgi:hypothetical protein